jgi:hypothetical protein
MKSGVVVLYHCLGWDSRGPEAFFLAFCAKNLAGHARPLQTNARAGIFGLAFLKHESAQAMNACVALSFGY